MPARKNITLIAVGVLIIVLGAIGTLIVTDAYNNYAVVDYQLQGPNSFFVSGNNYLDITLNEGNSGTIDIAPSTTISVVNATIVGVSIPDVAQFQLSDFCQYNSTSATISNLTEVKGSGLSALATIQISPNSGTQLFSISVLVSLPADWLHYKNTTMRDLPTELDYNLTSSYTYSLLQS